MSAKLSDLVKTLFDRSVATKRVSALTGGTSNVDSIVVTAGGSGYTSAPTVSFSGGGGSGAAGTAVVQNGIVVEVVITHPGSGYTSVPAVGFTGGGGTGATATAIMSANTLDAIATEDIDAGEMIALLGISGLAYIYQLTAGTDAESSPGVIRPDDYAASTNEKVWKLQGVYVNSMTILDGSNVVLGTGTGTKIGTATSQKLGFFDAAPVVQPADAAQAAVTIVNEDGDIGSLTFSATPTQGEVEALRDECEILADDVRNLAALVHALRTAGVNLGLWKGAA